MSIKAMAHSRWGKFVAAAILIAGIITPVVMVTTANASAPCPNGGAGRDCDANSLIWGGAYSKTEFDNTVFKNDRDLDGHTGLKAMYASFGITQSNFNSADTVQGRVYQNGQVIVGGKVVATNTWSSGRTNMPGSVAKNAGGTTVYLRPESISFASGSIAAFVNMAGGQFRYAVLMSCGNTVTSMNAPYGQISKGVTDVTTGPNVNNAADTQAAAITVGPGDTLKYQVHITNSGSGAMDNTVMTDNLPAGLALANGSANRNLVVSFGTVAAGKAVEADINVKVTQTTAGCINNIASFTGSGNQTGKDSAWICVKPLPTPTPTPVHTPTPTPVHTPTPTPVHTPTPTPVHTPTPTPVHTPTPTPTPVHTPTPTPTPVHTPTPTPTPSVTPTPTPTPTTTPTPTPTPSVTPTPTPTPTVTPTPTPVECTNTPTPTPTDTVATPTPTPGEVCGASTTPTTPALPDTGAAALGGIGGLGAMGYAARAYLMSKKSLVDSLRSKR